MFQNSNLKDQNWANIIKEIDENGDGEVLFYLFYIIINIFYFFNIQNLKI